MSSGLELREAASPFPSRPPPQVRRTRAHRGAPPTLRFAWVDQMAPALAGQLELIQSGPGSGGALVSFSIDGVEVQLGRYEADTVTRGEAAATAASLLIPLRTRTPGVWEGCPSHGGLLLYAPGAQQFAYDGRGSHWARISVGLERLERVFLATTGRELGLADAGFRLLRPESGALAQLRQRLRELPASVDTAAPREASRCCQAEQLIDALCRTLGSAGEAPPRRGRRIDPRRVLRAVDEYLDREIHESVYLADLAAAAHASERTVEYAFRGLLGLTPMHYVKLRRLARVHRVLRDSSPGSTTVTRVALDCGFGHLSQFARDYRRVYADTPSATLRRTSPAHEPRRASGH